MFIFSEIPQNFSSTISVCSKHFSSDCFVNLAQFNAGFCKTLLIKADAVPTLLGPTSNPQPGTSQDSQTTITTTITHKHASTQTDPPLRKTVGTQLSLGTLAEHVRSKATQTDTFLGEMPLFSTPLKGNVSGVLGSRPAKRPRLEEDEEEDTSIDIPEPQDSTYNPEDSVTIVTESSQVLPTNGYSDTKYIVYGSCLFELFETCPVCQRVCDVTPLRRGTFLAIDQLCPHCQYSRKWKSQPVFGSNPAGNLQLSAAIYFSGASFIQLEKIFNAMHIALFKYDTFRRHARMYLEPTIIHKWGKDQETLLQRLSQHDKAIIGGDMRADSPGHSAKYGSYSVMNLREKTIIDIQLVQSNEVGGSYHMELEGLKRSLAMLAARGIELDYIVTDRHPQIQKYLKDNNIKQFYDIWHLEKGLSKKLDKIAKEKDCQEVRKWQRSIKNHVYWTATSSTSGQEKVAKWKSLVNHLQDIHTHEDPLFPKCEHPEKSSTDPSKWLQPASKPLYKLDKTLMNKRVLKDVEKLSPHHQTSSLEAFHSVILRFAPKNVVFPYLGMLCRLYLAAMHFNENAHRTQAVSASGKPIYKIKFPKSKKGVCTAKPVKTGQTYNYVQELMEVLFENVFDDPRPYIMEVEKIKIPEPLSSQYERPPKDEVIAGYMSRFSREVV